MDLANLALFSAAALAIALSPGPGIFYVAARTLAGGRGEGLASSFGTGLGGLVHVAAGAVGVSALVMASAEAFTILKLAGALYLVWLGLKAIREARQPFEANVTTTGAARAFREGILVEALNPKTAAFFLAFLPQFVDPSAGPVWLQFLLLGLISVALNTAVDVVIAMLASRARSIAVGRPALLRRLRTGAGGTIAALAIALLFPRRPAALG
ncbi:LysE family translocator [Reyranella aquatilis]|uniref:LysE family translocator n=1 Tax=Reyranella aquatilis TaxID=2035356 RepID=A0ABS8KYN2_9HYPH|nr:LysE family translocator [Reyranella aquatilis]MCC8430842.1 LysE family translocator [Reyranella aquatilis]